MGIFRRFAPMFMSIAVIGIMMGVFLFSQSASATVVTGVTLADTDTTNPGLNGRDFTVTWTPSTTVPAGFVSTQIFITTSGVQLTTSTITSSTICDGSVAPQMRGFFNQFTGMNTFTLPDFPNSDSCNTSYASSSSYVAWVYVSSTVPFLASSTAVSYAGGFDIVADAGIPQVEFSSFYRANASATATIYAFLFDDQTQGMAFANPVDGGAEFFKLYYGADVSAAETVADAVSVSGAGDLYSFTIPAAAVPAASSTLEYYLVAMDAAGNKRFVCTDNTAVATATCRTSPFILNTVTLGGRTASGQISEAAGGLANVKVFAGGFAKLAATTDEGGNYTISGLPNNDSFDFTAAKFGYVKGTYMKNVGTSDVTGVNLVLNNGTFGFVSGGAGSSGSGGGAPTPSFSGPADGSTGVNVSDSIRVGFSQTMDGTTITTVNSVTSSNVYLVSSVSGVSANIPGNVTYCVNSSTAGCSALASMDTNVILFDPIANLSTSTQYTLVVTERVKSQSGQVVSGNRTGGGHKVAFTTMGEQVSAGSFGSIGTSGSSMPPYVRSVSPAPGITAAPNVPILIEFNEAMKSATIGTANIKLFLNGSEVVAGVSVSLDSTESRFATLSHSALTAGTYEVRVYGGASNSSGWPMRSPTTSVAFSSQFTVSGSNDTAAPTIYPSLPSNSTGVATNKIFDFGFSEQLAVGAVNNSNITMARGTTAVSVNVSYNPGNNSATLSPGSALAPNTVYTITFSPSVTDLAGNAIATTTYTYTTGAADATAPQLREARCDDYRCEMVFNEPMISDSQSSDSNWAASVLNSGNWTITSGGSVVSLSGKPFSYDSSRNAVSVSGLALVVDATVTTTVGTAVADLSENVVSTTARSFTGKVEDSKDTFGSFGDAGMFAPPSETFMGSGGIGEGEFKPMGFGSFTADQFAMGQADMAFPFNPMASADSNVFQVRFAPGVVLAAGDQVVLTFPNGTTVTNAAFDTYSPFYSDFNQFMAGTVTGTAILADNANNKVTITLGVSGMPNASDPITVDLKKIVNPSIPKDPSSGGYTVGIKVLRGGSAIATKTSMPYFIMAGGTNTLTVDVVAGINTSSPASGANGTVNLFGGGPGGPMNKTLTMTNGDISAVDGSAGTSITYNNLPDGCYGIGTEPFITLGSNDYFGQMSPESTCLSGGQSITKYLLLTPSNSGTGSATVTVKFAGIADFNGVNIDIFAGGPGKFVVKTLSAVGVPDSNGYNIKLPANGSWSVGVGPAMSKGSSMSLPTTLPGVAPSSIELIVSGLPGAGAVGLGQYTPSNVSFNDSNDTVTFTFAAADKTVSGTVKDGSGNDLANMNVFLHRQGFGAPVFGSTNVSGTFSLAVSDYGSYEIGVTKDGMPPVFKNIEVRNESGVKIYMDGKLQSSVDLVVNKAAYTISGKVLDVSNNGIANAPVFARDTNGSSVFGQTTSDGSYTLYVGNGTWTVQSQMPPSKSDTCGSFSITVTVSGSNQSTKNISSSVSSCNTLSGTISVGGTGLANAPLFIEEWNTTSNSPVPGGMKKQVSTDSAGAYSAKLAPGTYRLGTWDTTYGELSATKIFSATSTQNITIAATSTISFTFTGGSASMNGFLELKNSSDKTKRTGKSLQGLNTTATVIVTAGQDYNYFVDVFGVGKYSGTTTAGASVAIDLGIVASDYITVTGTIYSNTNTSTLSGSLVTFKNTVNGTVQTAVANASGAYEVKIASGTYAVSAGTANYVPTVSTQNITFNASTSSYDFGGASPDQVALAKTNYTIEGVVSSSAGAAMSEGKVTAQNASGTIVVAPINSNGAYSVPVTAGVWTIKSVGPNSSETTKSGTVTITNASSISNNFSLTANATNIPTSTTGVIAANAGGSINDTSASGIKITAGQGVLNTGSSNINITLEKSYTAMGTNNATPIGNTSFKISAKEGNTDITDLKGNAEIQLDFSSLTIPDGVATSDLKLMYYSSEKGDYLPVEGGFTVDATNKTITGSSKHFTDFIIAYVPTASNTPSAPTGLTATAASASQINLSWTAVSGATSYTVYKSTDGITYSSITSPATNSYNVTSGLSASTLYYFKVTATNSSGEGASSDAASATTNAAAASGGGGGGGDTDTTPPTGASISIAAGASSTATVSVTLTLAATGATQMMIANDSVFTGGTWEVNTTTKTWTLTSGAGVKTVYAKFRDSAGNISTAVSDTITLNGTVSTSTTTTVPVATTTPPPTTVTTTPPVISVTPAVVVIRFKNDLDLAARGDLVKDLQSYLKDLGYFTYPSLTGYYGPVTAKAVKEYQKANGLPPTGKLDKGTRDKLNGTASSIVVTPAVVIVKFKKDLQSGSVGDLVKDLQSYLKDLGYFTYPSITGYYGQVTMKAVKEYQKVNGLPPTGKLDVATRDKLNGAASAENTGATNPPASTGYQFTKYLGMGSTGEEVKQLQQVLKDLGYYTHPTITGYFGPATKEAVVKFQKAKDLKPYPGHVGPGTRTALNGK